MFGKTHTSLWDGTLATDWPGWSLFVFMFSNCDRDGILDMTPQAISARTGMPLDILLKAMERLSSPDPESRSDQEDGCRVVLIEPDRRSWGWRVVNYQKYRDMRDSEERRRQNAEASARYKERQKPSRVITSHHESSSVITGKHRSAQAEAEAEAEAVESKSLVTPRSDDTGSLTVEEWFEKHFWPLYPRKAGTSKSKALLEMKRIFKGVSAAKEDELAESIIGGLEREINKTWSAKEPEFIPHAATWLHQRRWETANESI